MAFLNSSLMFGGLFIALPLIIHMAMRRKPVPQLFPALRFVQQKQVSNQRTLRMKQWLLLFLRCLLVALLALAFSGPSADQAVAGNWIVIGIITTAVALVVIVAVAAWSSQVARPIVWSLVGVVVLGILLDILFVYRVSNDQDTVLIGDADAAVCAALIFDNSPRMSYQQEGETRLERAQEMATWLTSQLPEASDVAVLDRSTRNVVFNTDLNSTVNSIEQLQVEHNPVSLEFSIRSAMQLLSSSDFERQEIYLFTDLSKVAWESVNMALKKEMEQQQIELFLIDVGIESPANVALSRPELQDELMIGQASTEVSVDVSHLGLETTRTLQLVVEEVDLTLPIITDGALETPPVRILAEQDLTFAQSDSISQQSVTFSLSGLPQGVHHGQLRLLGGDGLSVDDVRHFTVSSDVASPILIMTAEGVPTRYFTQAIAPQSERQMGRARYDFTVVRNGNITERGLEQYASVILIDPAPLSMETWQHLTHYVSGGGSLGVFLGPNMKAENLAQEDMVASLLGGSIKRLWRSDERNFLEAETNQHRVLKDFASLQGSVPWAQFPVVRYWQMAEVKETAQIIMRFSRQADHPAILENAFGGGTVITMLTPISEPLNLETRTPWNRLASGNDNWPYFILINAIAERLVSNRESRLNYQVGEIVSLRNDEGLFPGEYQLFTPDADLQNVQAVDASLQVSFTNTPGAYRLKGQQDGPFLRGFSVNALESFSDLQRLDSEVLDSKLGARQYQLAKNQEEVSFGVRQRRVGQEFFAVLILLVGVVFLLEHLMSNRFYAQQSEMVDSSERTVGEVVK